jgi:hypothetical protein
VRGRWPLLVPAVVLVVVVLGLIGWRLLDRPSDLERAVGYLPDSTLRASYTDWAAVREQARGGGIGLRSTEAEVDSFLDRAFERGLTATSAVDGSTYALATLFGFSPAAADWEMLGQARSGQVVVLSYGEDVGLEQVEANLRSLGYRSPDGGPGSGGTWVGSADLAASIDPALTPVQQNFAVLPEDGLVLMSDAPEPVTATVGMIRSGDGGLSTPLTAAVGEPTNAVFWASDFACADLAMAQAGPEDQQQAAALVQQAGDVSPLSGLVMAQQPDRTITVAMRFESEEQATANLQPRVDLAAGEAPGQGGSFAERFRVTSGEADGERVVLTLQPRGDGQLLFSDITSGPVLFATC